MPRRSRAIALSLLPCGLLLTACGSSFQPVKPSIDASLLQPCVDPLLAPEEEHELGFGVDDSIRVRKFVGRMLEKAGYRVRLAGDGLEALEIALQGHCDLIITDLEMPRTNGYELLAHLRQDPQTRNIPVMVVTSRAGAKHRDRALKEGAAAFMTKPVQEEQFVEAVEKLIGSARPELTPAYA